MKYDPSFKTRCVEEDIQNSLSGNMKRVPDCNRPKNLFITKVQAAPFYELCLIVYEHRNQTVRQTLLTAFSSRVVQVLYSRTVDVAYAVYTAQSLNNCTVVPGTSKKYKRKL